MGHISTGLSIDLIITTFNRRGLVSRAVDSALAQECPGLLVTVVDDGSTDGTAEFLRERYGARIRVLVKPNGGLSSARNHGIAETEGDIIAFLDDDDELLPGKLARQQELLRSDPEIGFCYCAGYMVKAWREGRQLVSEPHSGRVLGDLLRQNFGPPHGFALRRSLAEEVGGFDETLTSVEDWEYWLRCAARSRCGFDPEPGFVYHLDHGNMSLNHENMLHHCLLVFDRHVGAWDGPEPVKRDYRAGHLVKFVRRLFHSGDAVRGVEVFRDALRESPLAVRLLPRKHLRTYLANDGAWFSANAPALAAAGSRHVFRAGLRQATCGDFAGARRLFSVAVRSFVKHR